MLSCFAVIEKSPAAKAQAARLVARIQSTHPAYAPCFAGDGLTVLTAGEDASGALQAYRLAGGRGVILGRLFRRFGPSVAGHVPHHLSEHESAQIARTSGRHLVGQYWGRYTAFLSASNRQERIALRDPSGALPLYFFETDACVLLFSNGADFFDLGLTRLSFNIQRMVSHIKMHLFDYADTGFNEIRKINRGAGLVVCNGSVRPQSYWHPGQFVEQGARPSHEDAARALHDVIVQCTGAWGGVFGRVGLSLSGGLDSSIVLAALCKAPDAPAVFATHGYYPASAESDERRWACDMAALAGVEIECAELRGEDIDPTLIRDFSFEAEPVNCLGNVMSGPRNRRFLQARQCRALFTGHGGDMIFLQGAMATAEDYVWNHGWGWRALHRVAENALITRNSFFGALRETLQFRASGTGFNLEAFMGARKNPLVEPELMEALSLNQECAHWLAGFQNVSLGKSAQLASSWANQPHATPDREGANGEGEAAPHIHPLLSQPVLETVARIPAYLFPLHGIDRGLARYAFRHDLPRSIVARQSKGSANDYYEGLFTRYLDFYRESLCDGVLMELGILDPKALERAFAMDISANSLAKYHVLELMSLEYWARWWRAKFNKFNTERFAVHLH